MLINEPDTLAVACFKRYNG